MTIQTALIWQCSLVQVWACVYLPSPPLPDSAVGMKKIFTISVSIVTQQVQVSLRVLYTLLIRDPREILKRTDDGIVVTPERPLRSLNKAASGIDTTRFYIWRKTAKGRPDWRPA